jgi:hypothetical protein
VNTTQIVLAGEPVASMTLAAARACAVPELPLAIIGGFAVTCRLGHVHRATGDVDAVADDLATVGAGGSSAQRLVDRGIAQPDPSGRDHRVFIEGTKLEIIDTQPLAEGVDGIESGVDRLFLLGHRWALESAEPLRVTVAGTDIGPRGLAKVVRELAAERFVDDAERVTRYMKVYGEPSWSEITAVDIRRVLGALVARLQD